MKLHTIFCILASSFALGQNASPAPDLLTALRGDPNTQAFGQLLEAHPDLLANLDPAKNYTVFAPSNAAVAEFQQAFNVNVSTSRRTLHRRAIPDYAAAIALLFTDRSNQGRLNFQPTDLITNLTDPAFVNLGPASASASTTSSPSPVQSSLSLTVSASSSVPLTTVSAASSSSSTSPPSVSAPVSSSSFSVPQSTVVPTSSPQPQTSSAPSSASFPQHGIVAAQGKSGGGRKRSLSYHHRRQLNESSILVSSGFGKVTEASLSEATFNNGAVRRVDSFFTLFGDLPSTLQQTNGTGFANSLAQAGLLDSLSNTPRITVFVPSDAVLAGQVLDASSLQRYVLPNTLATTAGLKAGTYKTSAGDLVNVTSDGGVISVNNATIVKPNVMIKNGVVHYIDNVYTGTHRGSAPGLTSSLISVVVAFAVASSNLF